MKKVALYIVSLFILVSCAPPADNATAIPEDLAGLKKMLAEQKKQAKELDEKMAMVQEKISELQPAMEKERLLVETEVLERKSIDLSAQVQGSVVSDDYAMASSETGGRLMSVVVNEGDYVRKGQLIATVDLESIEKQKAELQTALSLATDVFERQSRLWKQNIGSEIQYLEAKNSKERLEKSLETLGSQIAKKNVMAPISGVIDQKFLTQGELAGPGTPIVQILNTSALKVVADIPEKYIASVRRGQGVTVRYPALDIERKKSISMVGRTIDPSNRTFKVEIKTGNEGGVVKPFLLAQVEFVADKIEDVIAINPELIQEEVSGKKYVYKNDGGVAKKVYVETGDNSDDAIVITTGLDTGDEIITEGAFFVKEGELIDVKTSEE